MNALWEPYKARLTGGRIDVTGDTGGHASSRSEQTSTAGSKTAGQMRKDERRTGWQDPMRRATFRPFTQERQHQT